MLSTLHRIVQEVSSTHDFDEALLVLVKKVREVLETQVCSVYILDKKTSELVLLATNGLSAKAVGTARLKLNEGLVGLVGLRRETLNVANAKAHPKYHPIGILEEDRFEGFLGVPIIYQKRLLGVMVLQKSEAMCFLPQEEAFMVTLAIQLAEIVAHARTTGMMSHLVVDGEEGGQEGLLSGIASSHGVGIGQGVVIFPPADLDAVPDRATEDIESEVAFFKKALSEIREEIKALSQRLESSLSPEDQALFDAYLYMLDDAGIGFEVEQEIRKGQWAQGALKKVVKMHVRQFESMENEYLKERGEDVRDLGRRVLANLQSESAQKPEYSEKVILVGEEISAANLAEVPVGCLKGVISGSGSSNSHVAILARALGVPAIMGVSDLLRSDCDQQTIIVDGYYGHVYISPNDILKREFARLAKEEQQLEEDLTSLENLSAETIDAHTVGLYVNAGLAADVGLSLSVGADGVGLYRTEIPFLEKELFPSAGEQVTLYRQLLKAFSPRSVTMRTLDVGGDKPLPYFPIKEKNPFLGWRGIRILLDHPEVFLTQIRSMLKASAGLNNLRIMLPMVSDVEEVDDAYALIQDAYQQVTDDGIAVDFPKIGVMIEVPSAVYQTRLIAHKADFISVGSNDLTQYILAVDRNNAKVAPLYDSFHPAVLSALQFIVEEAHAEGKSVSLCGEMAGDPMAALLLLGMGFDSLSMSAVRIARIKWVIRQFSYEDTKALVAEVLTMGDASLIRNRLEEELEHAGLGGLIRAGRY